MFTAVLSRAQQTLLERLSAVPAVRTFYLAGGTGLALHLGHRRSIDFDFFRQETVDPAELLRAIGTVVAAPAVRRAEQDTLTVELNGIATSFFAYSHPLLRSLEPGPWSVTVAAIADIAAMKISAIAGRGARKDFVDLYFICKEVIPLPDVLQLFEEKFRGVPYERYHILKSLTYFDDAETELMPEMVRPVDWDGVKQFFLTAAPALFTSA